MALSAHHSIGTEDALGALEADLGELGAQLGPRIAKIAVDPYERRPKGAVQKG